MSYITQEEYEYQQAMAFECQVHNVKCVLCKTEQTGTQMFLEGIGWHLSPAGEVCGPCSKQCVEFRLKYRRDTQSMIERVNRKPDVSTHFSTMVGMGVPE